MFSFNALFGFNAFLFFVNNHPVILLTFFVTFIILLLSLYSSEKKANSKVPIWKTMTVAMVIGFIGLFALVTLVNIFDLEAQYQNEYQGIQSEQNTICESRYSSGSILTGTDDMCLDLYDRKIKEKRLQDDTKMKVDDINDQLKSQSTTDYITADYIKKLKATTMPTGDQKISSFTGGILYYPGNLTITSTGALVIFSGTGEILVEGNVYIDTNISYVEKDTKSKVSLSVGGNIEVSANVTNTVGDWDTGGLMIQSNPYNSSYKHDGKVWARKWATLYR